MFTVVSSLALTVETFCPWGTKTSLMYQYSCPGVVATDTVGDPIGIAIVACMLVVATALAANVADTWQIADVGSVSCDCGNSLASDLLRCCGC